MLSIAEKIGCNPETLRGSVGQAGFDLLAAPLSASMGAIIGARTHTLLLIAADQCADRGDEMMNHPVEGPVVAAFREMPLKP